MEAAATGILSPDPYGRHHHHPNSSPLSVRGPIAAPVVQASPSTPSSEEKHRDSSSMPHLENLDDSVSAHPPTSTLRPAETLHASLSSDSLTNPLPSPSPPPMQPLPNLPSSVEAVRARGLSVTSNTSSIRSLKRKPLPATASPLVDKYSSSRHTSLASIDTLAAGRFQRSASIDSPILYDTYDILDIPEDSRGRQRSST
jgi:hypothetical protein